MQRIPTALVVSVSLALATPALAQTAPPASPAPQTAPSPVPSMAPAMATTAAPATQSATQARPNGAPAGAALPPPPIPIVLPPVPSIAPNFVAPTPPALPAGELIGVQQQPFVGLNLQDAIGMALARGTDLALAQSNRRIAGYQIVAARGAYDVRFSIVPSYQHGVSPSVSAFQAGPGGGPITQDTTGGQAFFSGLTEAGTQYRVGGTAQRVSSNAGTNSYNPSYYSSFQVSITQPLLRGARMDDARRAIQLARAGADAQSGASLVQASQVVTNVANAYWDLVAAWRNVAIQEEGLRQAQAQAGSNARLAAAGAVAPADIVEANTQVNVFQDNVFSALQNVGRLQNQLKALILANPADPVWRANLVPTTSAATLPAEPSLDALFTSALRNRPEVAQVRAQRRTADVNLAYARDQLKPQLDLGLGYTSNGFAGVPTDPSANPIFASLGQQVAALNALIAAHNASVPPAQAIPPLMGGFAAGPSYQNGRLGQSLTNALDNRFPTYSAQLTFSVPLGNTTARANAAIAEEQERQAGVNETALVQRLRLESANALQGLREAEYRLVAARNAREAAERVLLAEQRRFRAGTSTTFLVLQRQLDVANQRGRELQAQTDLNKAAVELERVGGTVFAAQGIDASSFGAPTLDAIPSATTLPADAGSGVRIPTPAPLPRR